MGFRKSEPRKPLKFEITAQHCTLAKRKDACNCVIAQAFYSKFGASLASIHVLPTITTLIFPDGRVHRYRTSPLLRKALTDYDKDGVWSLDPGVYELLPLPKSLTAKAQSQRAKKRRNVGDVNMDKRYPYTGKQRRRNLDPRKINLRDMRAAGLAIS